MNTEIDLDAARHFATIVEKQSKEVTAMNAQVSRKLLELRIAWRDNSYDNFTKVFDETTKKLARFLEDAESFAVKLRKKVAILDRLKQPSRRW